MECAQRALCWSDNLNFFFLFLAVVSELYESYVTIKNFQNADTIRSVIDGYVQRIRNALQNALPNLGVFDVRFNSDKQVQQIPGRSARNGLTGYLCMLKMFICKSMFQVPLLERWINCLLTEKAKVFTSVKLYVLLIFFQPRCKF